MKKLQLWTLVIFVFLGCNKGHKPEAVPAARPGGGEAVIRYEYKPQEITQICESEIKNTDQRIADMLKIPDKEKNFENTVEAFEQITADLSENTTPATFMNYVSLNKDLRAEAEKCEATLGQYNVGLFTRRDIYSALLAATKQTKKKKLAQEDSRLIEQTLKAFRRNGLSLPDDKLKVVKELKQKLAAIETQFSSNLNESIEYEEMSPEDMDGIPESMMKRLTRLPNGKFKVTTKSTDFIPFMENAKSAEARRRLQIKYENRAADKNTKLLEDAVALREKIAALLGYKNWADYRTEEQMAKNSKNVIDFLDSLRGKLAKRNKEDLAKLLRFKKEIDPKADHLDPWDIIHYAYQLKKRDYSLDDEVIREYFPTEKVVQSIFDIYSRLLGVKFVVVPDAKVWAPHVNLYEIRNASDNSFVAYFFTDFVPREGKYGHAAAFTLRAGRLVNGVYRPPISSIVANFNPPTADKPSLLNHDEVETFFHEFGHIMHQTLTKAPYATLSGSSVAHDFVEAPSQMLENWVWDPAILKSLSGHYKDSSKKLPDDMVQKLIAARDFNRGVFYTRQLLFGIFDMTLHTSKKPLDPTETYKKLYGELTKIHPLPETHFPATFGHLMGGYDAGYYGYLWSEVFAEDMFTKFEKAGLLDPQIGLKYRHIILEKGDTVPADKLLVQFLGRRPNNKAFFKRLGIK